MPAFTDTGQGRKSSEDLSVTVSRVADRGSFDQCVSYTERNEDTRKCTKSLIIMAHSLKIFI